MDYMVKWINRVNKDLLLNRGQELGADLSGFNGYSDSVGPLHMSAMLDRVDAAQKLLEKGLEPDALSPQGSTPLHTAARYGAGAVAELLIRSGANRGALDAASETPLMVAASFGNSAIVGLLLENGAEAYLEQRDSHGNTALHLAAAADHLEVVNRLVTYNPNFWALNDLGETPLEVAKKTGSHRVRDFLAPRTLEKKWEDSDEYSLLQETSNDMALWVLLNQVDKLKQTSPDLLLRCNQDRKTLMHWAAIKSAAECAEFLLQRIPIDALDCTGSSPLHYAAINNAATVCDLLLKAGADVNLRENMGRTPLMLCMISGSETVAKKLVESGQVQLDVTDCGDETALMHAARQGSESLTRLVMGGSNVLLKNHCGLSALEICSQHGHDKVSALLEKFRPSLDVYPRRKPKNGYCLVINQIHKTPVLAENDQLLFKMRNGSQNDEKRIDHLFQGQLGFTVHKRCDLTSDQIIQELRSICSGNLSDIDYFVCFILAHGLGDAILGTDGKLVQIKDITAQVDAEHCRQLYGKPKIFFIQACRNNMNNAQLPIWEESSQQPGEPRNPLNVAKYIDFFFGFSTWEDCASYRSPRKGSKYIQTLCKVIEEEYADKDLLKMMTRVCQKIGSTPIPGKDACFMVPNIKSSLQKDVKF